MKMRLYFKDFQGKEVGYFDVYRLNWIACMVWVIIGFSLGIFFNYGKEFIHNRSASAVERPNEEIERNARTFGR